MGDDEIVNGECHGLRLATVMKFDRCQFGEQMPAAFLRRFCQIIFKHGVATLPRSLEAIADLVDLRIAAGDVDRDVESQLMALRRPEPLSLPRTGLSLATSITYCDAENPQNNCVTAPARVRMLG